MGKTLVIDAEKGTRAPFLRGILTRSVQEAGLGFDDAYRLASRVRQDLASVPEISTADLRARVIRYLAQLHGPQVVQRYATPVTPLGRVLVREGGDRAAPFSSSRYRRSLENCGVATEQAAAMTRRIGHYLAQRGEPEVSASTLGRLTYNWLRQDLGEDAARRYLVWVDHVHSGRPLLVFVGGAAGVGKSTVATELAARLDIVRTQSTDMLREVMRVMLPERLLPSLHASSFDAWRTLPKSRGPSLDRELLVAEGYQTQADLVALSCEAVVRRALKERVSLILEGVHVNPGLVERATAGADALVVPVMVAVLKPEELRARFRGRAGHVPQRRSERYLRSFDAIWALQEHLLSEADRRGMGIVVNDDKERAVRDVLTRIVDTLSAGFRGTPRQVFFPAEARRKRA
jgi:2-phosphoglycerate kinase